MGNIDGASSVEILRKYNIKAVLTVAARTNLSYDKSLIKEHKIVECNDEISQNLV